MSDPRYCIIGAGYVGNGVARAFTQAGSPTTNWRRPITSAVTGPTGYTTQTHLISSSAWAPLMRGSRCRITIRTSLVAGADAGLSGILRRVLQAARAHRIQRRGRALVDRLTRTVWPGGGWSWRVVRCANTRAWSWSTVTTGRCVRPTYPGNFVGRQLHSKQYRGPADLAG